jgi:hypothetical protein
MAMLFLWVVALSAVKVFLAFACRLPRRDLWGEISSGPTFKLLSFLEG